MANISITNSSISNSETADVTKLTANDNDIISGLTDTTKDISISKGTFAGIISVADGAVGSPEITFTNDTDSGVYRIGSNNIGVAVGGTKVIDIGASATVIATNFQLGVKAASGTAIEGSGGSFQTIVALPSDTAGVVHVTAAENGLTNVAYYQIMYVNGATADISQIEVSSIGTTADLTFQLSSANLQCRGATATAPSGVAYWIQQRPLTTSG